MDRFSLVGINGNAFSILGYTQKALKEVGREDLVEEMLKEATSSDYNNLIKVCQEYIDLANFTDLFN